jgi:uncharacterized iron-regulated membrane protein
MNLRTVVFWVHLATGCLVGAVVPIMSVTGVMLTYERQITAWVDRDFRCTPPKTDAARLPIEAMLAQVIARNPAPPSAITLRSDPKAPAQVSFGREHVFFWWMFIQAPFSAKDPPGPAYSSGRSRTGIAGWAQARSIARSLAR